MESDVIRYLAIGGRVECKMLPSCAEKHKKPVCTKCDGGTRCTKCCLYKPHQPPGRPRKDRSLPDTPVRASKAHHRVHENFTKLIRFVQD